MIFILKSEVNFGEDNFKNQNVLNAEDSITQLLLNLLFMKPGHFPSQPGLGIDIKSYLYRNSDSIDVEDLKTAIYNQCSPLMPYLDFDEMVLTVIPYHGQSSLLLIIPFTVEKTKKEIVIGFAKDSTGNFQASPEIFVAE